MIIRFFIAVLVVVGIVILGFKPISAIFIERNLSDLLKQKVVLTKYELFPVIMEAYKEETGQKLNLTMKIKWDLLLQQQLLNLDYVLNIPIQEETLKVEGILRYKDHLTLSGNTSVFNSKSYFKLDGEQILLNAKHIELKKALKELGQSPYAEGKIDLYLKGKIDNLDIKLNGERILTNHRLLGLKEYIKFKVDANYRPSRVTFKPYLKASMIELGKGDGVYDFKKKELYLKQNFIFFHKKIKAPLYVEATINKELIKVKSPSLGGQTTLVFKDKKVNITLNNVSLKTLDKLFIQKNILSTGNMNGYIHYDTVLKNAKTQLDVNSATVDGVDLDSNLGTLMDAIGLNLFSLKDELLDGNKMEHTKISHLKFDSEFKNDVLHLQDAAFSTPRFRISMSGDISKSGAIKSLDIYLLDKNGCSIIKQEVSGTLEKPVLENKMLTTTDVIVSIPSSIIKKPKELLNFTTNLVDDTASFLLNKSYLSDKNISIVSKITDKTINLVENTSDIVLQECKVVYDGAVKAPYIK